MLRLWVRFPRRTGFSDLFLKKNPVPQWSVAIPLLCVLDSTFILLVMYSFFQLPFHAAGDWLSTCDGGRHKRAVLLAYVYLIMVSCQSEELMCAGLVPIIVLLSWVCIATGEKRS